MKIFFNRRLHNFDGDQSAPSSKPWGRFSSTADVLKPSAIMGGRKNHVGLGDWHPAAFFLGWISSAIWLASWYLEPTRSLWLALDETVFWALNDSLADGTAWQVLWAIANDRATDVISASCMIGLFVHFARGRGSSELVNTAAIFLMFVVLAIAGVQLGKAMDIGRLSPTAMHDGALRLSELVSWMPTKDMSGDSFPGDHATVLLIFGGVVTCCMPRVYAIAAWTLATVLMLPRVVSGAHWLTDDLVGSVAITGFILSVVLATPLRRVMIHRAKYLLGGIRAYRSKE